MALISRDFLEWLRSPEAAKGLSTAEVESYENLWRRRVKVELRIRSAFADCCLGDGTGLLEAAASDMCVYPDMPRQARERDEREDWQRLSRDDLSRCNSALSFTDALGYRFLLPAFMLADLDGDLNEVAIIHLSLTKEYRDGTLSKLNSAQIEAIIEFLQLFLDNPDSSFHHEAIAESLNVFWRPLLQQRNQEAEQDAT